MRTLRALISTPSTILDHLEPGDQPRLETNRAEEPPGHDGELPRVTFDAVADLE